MARLLLRQNAAEVGEFAHGLCVEHITRDPIQSLQIPQAAAALLDIWLNYKRAVAIAAMAYRAFSLLRRDILGGAGFLACRPETAMEFTEQSFVAGQKPRVEQRGPNGCIFRAF